MAGKDEHQVDDLHQVGVALVNVLMLANDTRLWWEFGVLVEKTRIAARARVQLAELDAEPHEDGAPGPNDTG